MANQILNVPIIFDMNISYPLTAGETPSQYSVGTFAPTGLSGMSYTNFPVPAGLQFSILNYKLLASLTTDLYLSYILDGTVQSSLSDANFFVATLLNPSRLSAPIVIGPTHTVSLIAYPVSTVTTAATEIVVATAMLAPMKA